MVKYFLLIIFFAFMLLMEASRQMRKNRTSEEKYMVSRKFNTGMEKSKIFCCFINITKP